MEASLEDELPRLASIYRSRFELAPGMRLAKPVVVVERGRAVLKLPAGLELNELNLSQLAAARVECVAVVAETVDEGGVGGVAGQAVSGVDADRLAGHVARLDRLFAHTDPDSELTQAFKAAVMAHRRAECSDRLPVTSS